MGDPKKTKRKYSRPRKPWDKTRLDEERIIKENYGLKNKKELWMTEKMLKNKRQNARKLLALELEKRIKREKEILDSLKTIGILKGNATLDDVLGLKIEEFLERRLQTIIWRKGMANTPKQARQFIVHGHIAINGKKVSTPSYIVKADEEEKIKYYKKPLKLNTEKPTKTKEIKKEFEQPSFEEKVFKTEEKPTQEKKEIKEKPKVENKKEEVLKEKVKEEKPVKEETKDKSKEAKKEIKGETPKKEITKEEKIEDKKEGAKE